MNCKLKCTNPDEIKYSITITATAKEFKEMRDSDKLPWVFTREISDLLIQANQTFNPGKTY